MKTSINVIILSAVFTMGANSLLLAQPGNSYAEQWYRAKFGRPSPTEQARIDAAQKATTTQPAVTAVLPKTALANTFAEQLHRAKYGRPTPREEARLREANLGKNETLLSRTSTPANERFENWYRAKYGRPSPLAEAANKGRHE